MELVETMASHFKPLVSLKNTIDVRDFSSHCETIV